MKRISVWWWIVVAIACMLWLPWLLSKGMFLDGVYNAVLAINLAQGIGTFWTPSVNYIDTPFSWGCAPFSVFTLSLLYKIVGTNFVVEKLYSLICAIIQIILIAATWKSIFPKNEVFRTRTWLPCIVWLASPLTGWCFSNNLMENTMVMFTTASILVFLLHLQNRNILYPIIGSAIIFLAVLSKGPVGLFPLGAPLIYILASEKENHRHVLRYFGIQLISFITIFTLVFSFETSKVFLQKYVEVQLEPALNHNTGKTSFEIILQLGIAISPMLVLYLASLIFPRFHHKFGLGQEYSRNRQISKMALVFIAIGLSASLPIIVSVKQSKFYLLPSISMFSIGFSILIIPFVKKAIENINDRWAKTISNTTKVICSFLVLISIGLCLLNQNTYSRDADLLGDVDKIQKITGNKALLRAGWELNSEWHLFAYLNRLYDIRVCMPNAQNETPYYITYSTGADKNLINGYHRIYSGEKFDLYSKSNYKEQR